MDTHKGSKSCIARAISRQKEKPDHEDRVYSVTGIAYAVGAAP